MNSTKHNWSLKIGQFPLFLLLFAGITVVSILTSFFPVWANLPINIILPIVMLLKMPMVRFERVKLSTLLVMRTLILLPVFGLMTGPFYVKLVLVFLIINILEATFSDLLKSHLYFNFITGLVLAASVLCLGGTWYEGFAGPFSAVYTADAMRKGAGIFGVNDVFIWGTVCWILAYTIWNWIFVIGEFDDAVSYLHIGILLSPILSCVIFQNPGYWLIFRANSLTCGGVFQIGCKDHVEASLGNMRLAGCISVVKKPAVQCLLMVVNLTLIAVPVVGYFL